MLLSVVGFLFVMEAVATPGQRLAVVGAAADKVISKI